MSARRDAIIINTIREWAARHPRVHPQLERDELDALLRAVDERDNLRRQLCAEVDQ